MKPILMQMPAWVSHLSPSQNRIIIIIVVIFVVVVLSSINSVNCCEQRPQRWRREHHRAAPASPPPPPLFENTFGKNKVSPPNLPSASLPPEPKRGLVRITARLCGDRNGRSETLWPVSCFSWRSSMRTDVSMRSVFACSAFVDFLL